MIAVMIGGATAMLIGLFATRYLITLFGERWIGQPVRGRIEPGPSEPGPEQRAKRGTPTMGGLAIIGAALLGWMVAHLRPGLAFSDQAMIMWVGILAIAGVGLLDDLVKIRRHGGRVILNVRRYITLALSVVIVWWLVAATGLAETISFTRAARPGWEVPLVVFVVLAGLLVWSTANAVNITDGLDGLAGGAAMMGFLVFTVIAYWAFRNPGVYSAVVNPLDLAVLASAFGGACAGFLWFNAAPARIVMGEVGALGIGTALALLALTTNTHLLLFLICGVNVIEAGSVVLQMGVFELSGHKKRLFRMSPIHHHFELSGWPETTVIIRFWVVCGICVAAALGIFIGDFTRVGEL